MKPTTVDLKKSQHGAATLVVVLVLTMIMAVVSITTARTGIMEQKMTGNDLRAREAQEAAEAGLEYGIAWASKNNVPWPSVTGLTLDCPSDTGCPTLPQVTGSSTGEAYNIALEYYRPSATSDFIRVTSTSKGANDAAITATIQVYVKPGGILTSEGELPPPVVMDGCMTTGGAPNIYPPWNDIDSDGVKDPNEWTDANGNGIVDSGEWIDTNSNGIVDNEIGIALMTSHQETVAGSFCLDYCGPGNSCDASAPGTGHAHLDLNNGLLQNDQLFPNDSIWDYYFDVSLAQFQAAASTILDTQGGLYWVTSSGNWTGGAYGSATDPVIIVFTSGCPKPTGNTTVYGILFFYQEDACEVDFMNGWGDVIVYGSIGVNGGIEKMNANLEIHGVGDGSGGIQTNIFRPIDAARLPGTWKDF